MSEFINRDVFGVPYHGMAVPFVSHVDYTEHDVDIIVTEQGYADLRGLAPKERVELIIERCAHPMYREQLRVYYEEAVIRHMSWEKHSHGMRIWRRTAQCASLLKSWCNK